MNTITIDDVNYLAQQSSGRINMILSGMTALMNDTDNKVEILQSQDWFQRMAKTVTGKNKLTQLEIQQNHDKLNAYMSEAIAELYNRNCIDHEIIMSLGNQLNELYAEHLQLKQMLGAFVSKLNEKIDSIDNFHMLNTEIEQGVYSSCAPLTAICKILASLDNRCIQDARKLGIIKRSMENQHILKVDELLLSECLIEIADVPIEEIGSIYIEVSTIKDNFFAQMILKMIESYHFLPDMTRKMKSKKAIAEAVLQQLQVESSTTISINDIFSELTNSKIDMVNGLLPLAQIQFEQKLNAAENLYLNYNLSDAFDIFKTLAKKGNGRAMFYMGQLYEMKYGSPVECDDDESEKWYRLGDEVGDALSGLQMAYYLPKDAVEHDVMFKQKFSMIFEIATAGDPVAQYELAQLYQNGYGTKENEDKYIEYMKLSADGGFWKSMTELGVKFIENEDISNGMKYLELAANLGDPNAQAILGAYYYDGDIVHEDDEKAIEWFTKAAKQGEPMSMEILASFYKEGFGSIAKDQSQAYEWYLKAAQAGNADAQYEIGEYYYRGIVVEQSYKKAAEWYELSAEQGNAEAQYSLGYSYFYHLDLGFDFDKAKKWLNLAAQQGHKSAKKEIEKHPSILDENYDISTDDYSSRMKRQGEEALAMLERLF